MRRGRALFALGFVTGIAVVLSTCAQVVGRSLSPWARFRADVAAYRMEHAR